jgi:hypothetical protein
MELTVMMRFIAIIVVFAATLAIGGCAKAPSGGPGAARRLVITMQVAGVINPNDFYYVAIDNDGNPNDGPQAVVSVGANGWGTGSITHYVQFSPNLPQGGYGLFRLPDVNVNSNVYLGPPVNFVTPGPSGNTLRFTIDLDSLALPPQTSGNDIQTLEINFITTDHLLIDPNGPTVKQWDALGNHSSNSYLRLNVTPGRIVSNDTDPIEPEGDVANPDLDIVNWSVEVQQL